jgi:8-oxo-dGTP pyrophosphatase MutT (NUDIX family)
MEISIEEIRFALQQSHEMLSENSDRRLRKAAVLLPIFKENQVWRLLFTRRTDTVQDHKGQVSFPGGAMEIEDRDLEVTALREAQEEIGLNPASVQILGSLRRIISSSQYIITPFVGQIEWPFPLIVSEHEVSRVFSIPLNWLVDPNHHALKPFLKRNGETEIEVFYEPYDGEVVWGLTGQITENFIDIINQ